MPEPEKTVTDKLVRKSRISKSIERIFNIAQYESLKVCVHIDEEIEWASLSERNKKSDNWTKVLMEDFNTTVKAVFDNQKVESYKAFHKDATPVNSPISLVKEQAKIEKDAKVVLDELDTIES
jgi:hypothetical protein